MSDAPLSPSTSTSTRDSNRELLSVLSTPSAPPSRPRPALPQELILQILSHPSRWVCAWRDNIVDPPSVRDGSRILLRTPPLTARSAKLLREVVFTIRSHDQGWSWDRQYHGTFDRSFTWFDAAVASKSVEPVQEALDDTNSLTAKKQDSHVSIPLDSPNIRTYPLQNNKHAVSEAQDYRISIDRGHEILDDLKNGDQILLVACARYPGWVNFIENAGIEVWAEDDLND